MSKTWAYYHYSRNDDFKLLKLPYERGQDETRSFSMYIFLPHQNNGLHSLIDKYFINKPEFILQKNFSLRREELKEVRIPKFKFSDDMTPIEVMKKLGLTLPFENTGDLNGIVDPPLLGISDMIQKSHIEVNEEGTEAASATALTWIGCAMPMMPPPPAEEFIADHPFVFMIREDNSGVIFFLGAVLNPLV